MLPEYEDFSAAFDASTLTDELVGDLRSSRRAGDDVAHDEAVAAVRGVVEAEQRDGARDPQEVEDALALERHQIDRVKSLKRQLALARTAYIELRNQYLNGAADFIDVLAAVQNQQELERSVLAARLMRIEHRIALHRAIAGGFVDSTPTDMDDGAPSVDETKTEGIL